MDDQGHQYNQMRLDFASKTSWLDHTTDLIPGISVSLILDVPNTPNSVATMNAQLSYGVQAYTGQYLAPNATFGKVTITGIPVTH